MTKKLQEMLKSGSLADDLWGFVWSQSFLAVGFAACFSWEGAIELKILLIIILILSAYAWNLLSGTREQIEDKQREIIKNQAILFAMLYETRSQIIKSSGDDSSQTEQDMINYFNSIEVGLEQGLKEALQLESVFNPKPSGEGSAIIFIIIEVIIAAILGWFILWVINLFA